MDRARADPGRVVQHIADARPGNSPRGPTGAHRRRFQRRHGSLHQGRHPERPPGLPVDGRPAGRLDLGPWRLL